MTNNQEIKISEDALYFLTENEISNEVTISISEFINDTINVALEKGSIDFSKATPDELGQVYLVFISVYSLNKDCSQSFRLTYGVLLHESDYTNPLFIGIEKIEMIEGTDNTLDAINQLQDKPEYVFSMSQLDNTKKKYNDNMLKFLN